ncbi:MAG TPA: PIG-L family deacetylase [Bryobacteraceae bacterium]|nr:PIG-L family deacetylase [Bryobacteraceae bacterium]
MPFRILAVFAHPDDETFLAGGTLAKYAAEGHDVFVVSATRGEAGKRGEYEGLPVEEFALVREREMQAACRVLGLNEPVFLDCADKQLARTCWDSATNEVVRYIRKLKPHVVITFGPDGVSGHPDHIAISQIVTSAVWGAGNRTLISAGEPSRPSSLYYVLRSESVPSCCKPSAPVEAPPATTVIDINGFGERKLEAIRCYRSQNHLRPEDASRLSAVLHAPEHFHRVLPACSSKQIEDHLFVPFL